MRNNLIVAAALAVALGALVFPAKQSVRGEEVIGLPSLPTSVLAQAGSESITMTTVPNAVTRYVFGTADGYADAVVKISLRAACLVRVTRIPVQANDIANRCQSGRDASLRALSPVLEVRNPTGPSGPVQFSIYRIEALSSCPPTAFPVKVDILYFGQAGEADLVRTRMVRDSSPPAATDCREVTTDISVSKDPNDVDPQGSGEEPAFSDYFLANLPPSALPTQMGVDNRFADLRALVSSLFRSEASRVANAQSNFDMGASQVQQGNLNGARMSFQMSIGLLDQFINAVEDARRSAMLTPQDAAALTTLAQKVKFHIRAFARRNGIDL